MTPHQVAFLIWLALLIVCVLIVVGMLLWGFNAWEDWLYRRWWDAESRKRLSPPKKD